MSGNSKNGTYKTYKVTDAWLESLNACQYGRDWFKAIFPKGVTISNSQEEMCELVSGMDEGAYGFLKWFASEVSTCYFADMHPVLINDVDLAGLLISEAEVFA